MKLLLEKFENFGQTNLYLKKNARILIGISGGADSVALTLLFKEFQKKYSLFLLAAHVNYHLRGEESNKDEMFVKKICYKENIPLYILQATIDKGMSLQKEARDIRLNYFLKLKKYYKLDYIALGHHYEDQTETILHRFLRGSGFSGLCGIKPVKDSIIHPLLPFNKKILLEYLNTKNEEHRVDQSNFTNNYTRNKIRNDLIPILKKDFNPNIEQKLTEYAELFLLSDNYFNMQAKKIIKKTLLLKSSSDVIFDVTEIKKIHPILLYYVLREAWTLLTNTEKDFYNVHFQHILSILEVENGYKEIMLPENIIVMKDYKNLIFRKLDNFISSDKEVEKEITSIRNVFSFNESRIHMQRLKFAPDLYNNEIKEAKTGDIAMIDLDMINFPVKVRYRKDGDRFIPFGMKGFKKLKNFFIDEKVPLKERDNVVIFCDDEKIFWVSGFRIDQRVAVTNNTKNVLCIKIEKTDTMGKRKAIVKN